MESTDARAINIEDLRRWHWLLIGAVVGLLVGFGGMFAIPAPSSEWRPAISDIELANALIRGSASQPGIRDLTLNSQEDGRMFVTGDVLRGGEYCPFALYTSKPFPAGSANTAPDFLSYVERLRAAGRTIILHNPWWNATWFQLAWPTLAGIIVIGGIWPTVLNLMIGAGFGRRKEFDPFYDLERFGKGGKAKPSDTSSVTTVDDRVKIDQISDQIAATLENPAGTDNTPPSTAAASPIVLTGGPVEQAPAPTDGEPKEYKGVYYPVAKPTRGSRESSGFSLVELLVVIGVIGILIGMFLPALAGARRSANVIACASNLRQLCTAMQSYLNDNGGFLFWRGEELQGDGMDWYAYGGRETGNANMESNGYFNQMIPRPLNKYLANNMHVFHCPCDNAAPWGDRPSNAFPPANQFDWVGNSYNFNANGYPLRPPPRHGFGLDGVKITSIRDSSHTILFYEACLYWGGDWHYSRKGNFAYADSHATFQALPPIVGEDLWDP